MVNPNPNIVQNEWQYGICECYKNPGICMKTWCCMPCVTCSNGEAVGKDGMGWCLIVCCLPWVATAIFRSAAREKYGIEGGEMEDWVCGICCGPLVDCQTAAEHEERNNNRS